MPAPATTGRQGIEYVDIRRDGITMYADATLVYDYTQPDGIPAAVAGRSLTITSNDHVGLCQDGDPVVGRLEQLFADGGVAVQFKGMCDLPVGTSGTGAVVLGQSIVGAIITAGSLRGYIRQVNTAVAAELAKMGASRVWNTGNVTNPPGNGTCVVDLGG